MLPLPYAAKKSYGVLGLGKSGRSTIAALRASGATVYAWDDNEKGRAPIEGAEIKMPADWPWDQLNALVMSPGIPLYHPTMHPVVSLARKANVAVVGDIELLYRAAPEAKYIAITGTNGKSTTTTLIGHILKSCGKNTEVGGNLGRPVLEFAALDAQGTYVLELSSYQLDLVRTLHVNVAVWLNISPDHIDHHGSMEAYVDAKRHIFAHQKRKDVAIIAVDDPTSARVCKELQAGRQQSVIPVSGKQQLASGIFVRDGKLTNSFGLTPQQGDLTQIKSLQGEHNWQNAAAAYAACYASGCQHDEIIAAMQTYPGLAHRMQWLGEIQGVTYVNDSKATNADAAEQALRTYDNMYWIVGGVAKEGGIESLAKYFPKVKHAYLIGEAAKDFEKTLNGKVPFTHSETLEKAFYAAKADAAKSKGVVLLAPACASFDQFPNFEVRGDAFMKLVEAARAA